MLVGLSEERMLSFVALVFCLFVFFFSLRPKYVFARRVNLLD